MYTQANFTGAFSKATNALIDARLRGGHTVCLTMTTTSMSPTLVPGDRLVVAGTRAQQLRPGDIVVRNLDQVWLAHRLIGFRPVNGTNLLVTKGDNNVNADAAWSFEQLGGIVTALERDSRRVNLLSRRARGAGVALAFLSRLQWQIQQATRGLPRRFALKTTRIMLVMSALVARALIG